MTDLFAGFTSTFADKALSSQNYPLTFHFEPKTLLDNEPADGDVVVVNPNGGVDVDPESRGQWEGGGPEESEALLDVTLEGFLEALAVSNAGQKKLLSEPEKELIDLFGAPIATETIDLPNGTEKSIMELTTADLAALHASGDKNSIQGLGKLWKKIKSAIKKVAKEFLKNFKKFLAKYFRFTVEWAKVRVEKKPVAIVKNPIELNKLDLYGQVRIEACIKLGKWRCAHITSPWVHVPVGSARFKLDVKGPLVLGAAQVKDVDFVMTIRLFGFKFDIKIGLTGIVNKQLAKRPPEVLLDTSKVSYELPMLKTKFVVGGISFSSGNSYLETDLVGQFVPI